MIGETARGIDVGIGYIVPTGDHRSLAFRLLERGYQLHEEAGQPHYAPSGDGAAVLNAAYRLGDWELQDDDGNPMDTGKLMLADDDVAEQEMQDSWESSDSWVSGLG